MDRKNSRLVAAYPDIVLYVDRDGATHHHPPLDRPYEILIKAGRLPDYERLAATGLLYDPRHTRRVRRPLIDERKAAA